MVAGVLLGAVLMIATTRGDLHIDEVVSLQKAESSQSWTEIITRGQNDNNHLLNTFILYLLGARSELFVYRIPAVLFGVGTLLMLGWTARRWGKPEAAWVVWLAGLSCPMILYCSEARGYAPAMFFGVVAFELLSRLHEKFSPAVLAGFWAALCLGFLSHFSFVMVAGALGGWSLVRECRTRASWQKGLVHTTVYFAVPAIFLAGLYFIYIRHMYYLGGNIFSRLEVIGATMAQAVGAADLIGWYKPAAMIVILAAGIGILMLYKRQRDEWIFFSLVLWLVPWLVVVVLNPQFLYFRYFLVCFPFFYLLLALVLAQGFRVGSTARWLAVIVMLSVTVGQLAKDVNLLRFGRGQYRQALLAMAAATPGPVLHVGSDHDFRNGTLLKFYASYLPPGKTLDYIPCTGYVRDRPDWFIVHCFDLAQAAHPETEVNGVKYNLFGTYPFGGQSGWSWFVYQRTNSPVAVSRGT
jgi:hypothetical protein